MPTQAEFDAALADVGRLANDLATWFGLQGIEALKSQDPRAARAAAMFEGGQKSAKKLGAALVNISSIFNQTIIESPGGNIHYGVTSHPFVGGTSNESDTQTVIGQDWVEAGSLVIPISTTPPGSSAVEVYVPIVNNLVVGVGFDVVLTTQSAATPIPYTGTVFWFSFG